MGGNYLKKYGKLKAAEEAIGLPVKSAKAYGNMVLVWATNGKMFWWDRRADKVARYPRKPDGTLMS